MLKIQSIQDKTEQKNICAECGAAYDADALAYKCIDTGDGGENKLAGCVQFRIIGKKGYIISLSDPSNAEYSDALFLLGRSALNFINLCSIDDAYVDKDCACPAQMLSRIGFRPDPQGSLYMNLKNFFAEPCAHDSGR